MKKILLLAIPAAAWAVPLPPSPHAAAAPLGTAIPADCTAHTSFSSGADLPGDYRCAGLAMAFHTAGADRSPYPLWAGQWLFVDADGQYRVGTCTFNRGVHPSVLEPSAVVPQTFPNDPDSSRGAYLAWRYGDTTDDLTAAALWAVFHYYAQDAAGSTRSDDPQAPLIASLDRIAAASGRVDLQSLAERLDAEARRYAAPWALTAAVDAGGTVDITLESAGGPVDAAAVEVEVGGSVLSLTTGADGHATAVVPAAPGNLQVAVRAAAPGPAVVYRGPPVDPDHPLGAQLLVTGGTPADLAAEAATDVPVPTTTAVSTTTAPATTTTTTITPTTTTTETPRTATTPTTEAGTTTTEAPTTTTAPTASSPPSTLPETGGGTGSTAYVATCVLVCGIGLVGAVRRRGGSDADSFWSP